MSHAFIIAAIFTAYFGSMTALGFYITAQVRHREREPDEDMADLDVRHDDTLAVAA